ncbi:AraC family transcriptional regulator [Flavobacterium sp.]|uniref:AraC family transcriptional regulator n=1 Tax=Flavobacterium sp. TaxID=239 RepID=UPI002617616E|nr:AraC family transcriptional regulator [Flavobacterium sp.]
MKAVLEDITQRKGSDSFVAYSFEMPFFEFRWHYHPEYELTLITEGKGNRIVGDSHEGFAAGDLVLLGSGLPHTWAGKQQRNKKNSAVVIQFSEAFISKFTALPEGGAIRKMLENAAKGFAFPNAPALLRSNIEALPEREGIAKVIALLEILHTLSEEMGIPLSNLNYAPVGNVVNENRINKICGYIQQHADEQITLEQVAGLVHLSKSAFCKLFKRMVKINFSDYINEIRIANSCQLLLESDKTVREIAMQAGFESLTYFNRVFLKKKGLTPMAFRKQFLLQ